MTRTFSGRKALAPGLALLAIGLLAPTGAGATSVMVDGGNLAVTAGPDEVNQVTVERVGSFFRIFDDTAVVTTSDPDCTGSGGHFTRCTATGVTSMTVFGRSLNDRLTVSANTPATINGGPGGDLLQGGSAGDTLIAGAGAPVGSTSDSLFGGEGADTLHGPTGLFSSSFLSGDDGADILIGGPGSESLAGGAGPDDISGGDGNDTVSYSSSGLPVTVTINNVANDGPAGEGDNVRTDIEGVFGSGSADELNGSPGPDSLFGGSGTDILRGNAGSDELNGGDGDDTLHGGSGADSMSGGSGGVGADTFIGGAGFDLANYSDHFDALTPLTITINDLANDGAPGENDNVRTDVEQIQGGSAPDTIAGSGQANVLIGGEGDDTINGGAGADSLYGEFLFGGGSPGADRLNGGPGDDVLNAGPGPDHLIGGDDFDAANYGSISVPLTITINDVANDGAAGENDNVRSTVESVFGGATNDVITGNTGPNVLFGGGGADTLTAGGGDDLLDGETPGQFFTPGGDTLIGGGGTDGVSYASHFSPVTADPDNVADDGAGGEGDDVRASVENLFGGPSNDDLTGSAGPNVLDGGLNPNFDADTLNGLEGADFLSGGSGSDTANGDAGNDRIHSRGDGVVDTDNCGADTDTVEADSFDTLNDCENVFNLSAFTPAAGGADLEDEWRDSRRTLRSAERLVERATR